MRFLNGLIRLLAVVLLLAVALALLASWLFGWDLPARMEAFRLTAPLGWRLLAGAGCLLTAAAAVAPLLPRRKKRGDGYVVQRFDADSVCVSRGAVEAIAARCIREHKELEGAKITVTDGEAGLTVEAACKLVSGASLSQSVDFIQRQIRRHITDSTGLRVAEVVLRVEGVVGRTPVAKDIPSHGDPEPAQSPEEAPGEISGETPEETPEATPEETPEEKNAVPAHGADEEPGGD